LLNDTKVYPLETLVAFLDNSPKDTHQRMVFRLVRPPRGGSPLGRLLVINVREKAMEMVVTVGFEEYLS
jgi:hypothetical protein